MIALASGTQLGGTAVTGNANITAGSEASLILLQITGSSGSDLDGTIEVFGAKARIIIANPNGLSVMVVVLSIRIEWIW